MRHAYAADEPNRGAHAEFTNKVILMEEKYRLLKMKLGKLEKKGLAQYLMLFRKKKSKKKPESLQIKRQTIN